MIYYFSGTGNSRHVSTYLAEHLNLILKFIPDTDPTSETCVEESTGFIFPVYSWGVPPLVIDFISKLPERFWIDLRHDLTHLWCVMTCGDEVALAPEMLRKEFRKHGVELNSIWSVIMPNNYVLLPGFDVDPESLEKEKLKASASRMHEIARGISQRMATIDVTRGSMPYLKTKIVYPLFKKWGISPGKWIATDECISCGRCEKVCPLHNIAMNGKRPEWGDDCCSCLACYHVCPRHAVSYGASTLKKRQYRHFLKSRN